MESWSLNRVAQASGRSVEHVRQMCRRGLMPADAVAVGQGKSAALPPELAEAMVKAFSVRLLSPALVEEIRQDPGRVREALEALATVLALNEADMAA